MKHRLITALAIIATATPAASQTILDRLVQRITRPKPVAPVTVADDVASAATATAPVDFRLDIAGVRLGMTPADAQAALTRAGYRPAGSSWLTYGPSFASGVRREAERRRTGSYASASMADQVVTGIAMTGPNRESVSVRLEAVPTGSSVVTAVDLSVPADVMTGPALLRQATAKYGRPDGQGDGGLTAAWCSAPVRTVCGSIAPVAVRYGSLPNLRASTGLSGRYLWLSEGTERGRQRERDFAAAVDRAAPKSDHAAF